jgi:hypothetical protein
MQRRATLSTPHCIWQAEQSIKDLPECWSLKPHTAHLYVHDGPKRPKDLLQRLLLHMLAQVAHIQRPVWARIWPTIIHGAARSTTWPRTLLLLLGHALHLLLVLDALIPTRRPAAAVASGGSSGCCIAAMMMLR